VTQARSIHHYTYAEYLELEEGNASRHEFLNGEIYAMAGGTPKHAALAISAAAALLGDLRGGRCRVHNSDLRVRVVATGLATYPDVSVVCGPYEYDTESRTTVTNPKLIVEVTSDGTEEYDRGEKLESYKLIASVTAILVVSHRERSVDLHERRPDGGWSHVTGGPGERLSVADPACTLSIDEIYDAAEPAPA
jgi:Uma2 family endonuclease